MADGVTEPNAPTECTVYVLRSEATGRYYIGSAAGADTRLREHNAGKVRSTKGYRPWLLIYQEQHLDRRTAARRERLIKAKKSRRWIEQNLLRRSQGL